MDSDNQRNMGLKLSLKHFKISLNQQNQKQGSSPFQSTTAGKNKTSYAVKGREEKKGRKRNALKLNV